MTEQDIDHIAQGIYERATVRAGYYARPWQALRDAERWRWREAAKWVLDELGHEDAQAAGRGTGRRAAA